MNASSFLNAYLDTITSQTGVKTMFFNSTSPKPKKLSSTPQRSSISIRGEQNELLECIKYVGIRLDDILAFTYHTTKIR